MAEIKLVFNAEVVQKKIGGQLRNSVRILNTKYYQQHMDSFFPGDKLELRMKKITRARTLNQNAFYWGAVLPTISEATGDNPEDLHEFFKRKLLPAKNVRVLGQDVKMPQSTTGLSKVEFGEYLDKIEALTEIPLPNPEDAGYVK